MKHTPTFVDPRPVRSGVYTARSRSGSLVASLRAAPASERCPCGATGVHSLCPLQPLSPEIRNAAL